MGDGNGPALAVGVGELGAKLGATDGVAVRLGAGDGDFNATGALPPHAVAKTTTKTAPARLLMQEG